MVKKKRKLENLIVENIDSTVEISESMVQTWGSQDKSLVFTIDAEEGKYAKYVSIPYITPKGKYNDGNVNLIKELAKITGVKFNGGNPEIFNGKKVHMVAEVFKPKDKPFPKVKVVEFAKVIANKEEAQPMKKQLNVEAQNVYELDFVLDRTFGKDRFHLAIVDALEDRETGLSGLMKVVAKVEENENISSKEFSTGLQGVRIAIKKKIGQKRADEIGLGTEQGIRELMVGIGLCEWSEHKKLKAIHKSFKKIASEGIMRYSEYGKSKTPDVFMFRAKESAEWFIEVAKTFKKINF